MTTVSSSRIGCYVSVSALFLAGFSMGVLAAPKDGEYCAFVVAVRAPAGKPVPNVGVVMVRTDRTTYAEAITDGHGIARMCNAPMSPVTVVVGNDICGSVAIRNLPPSWPNTTRLFVTYVESPCDHLAVSARCRVLFRVVDDEGRPIAGAIFRGQNGERSEGDMSDVFGRIFKSVSRGASVSGIVNKGEMREAISRICQDDMEIAVVLRHRPDQ